MRVALLIVLWLVCINAWRLGLGPGLVQLGVTPWLVVGLAFSTTALVVYGAWRWLRSERWTSRRSLTHNRKEH
jgi:hypothetical protein